LRTLVANILVIFLASSVIAEPAVDAHISRQDVRDICQLIGGVTAQPVRFIHPVVTRDYVPGAIAQDGIEDSSKGRRRIKLYERTDRVSVQTGYKDKITGGAYEVQKVGTTLKVVSRSSWIR
jgi:hypothetical protein